MRLEQDESDFLAPRQTIRDQYFAGIDSEPIWNSVDVKVLILYILLEKSVEKKLLI